MKRPPRRAKPGAEAAQPEKLRRPTKREQEAFEALSRIMSPEEWAEYDAGKGVCTNMAGWEIGDSIGKAKKLVKALPGIVDLVLAGR